MQTDSAGGGAAAWMRQTGLYGSGRLDESIEVMEDKVGALDYPNDKLHAIMADLSVRLFKKGTVTRRNVLLENRD